MLILLTDDLAVDPDAIAAVVDAGNPLGETVLVLKTGDRLSVGGLLAREVLERLRAQLQAFPATTVIDGASYGQFDNPREGIPLKSSR